MILEVGDACGDVVGIRDERRGTTGKAVGNAWRLGGL